jgi:hypothetical protein
MLLKALSSVAMLSEALKISQLVPNQEKPTTQDCCRPSNDYKLMHEVTILKCLVASNQSNGDRSSVVIEKRKHNQKKEVLDERVFSQSMEVITYQLAVSRQPQSWSWRSARYSIGATVQ